MGGAVAVRSLERVADVALGRERESLDRHRRTSAVRNLMAKLGTAAKIDSLI
jgi:hypothetical protein